MIFVPGDGEGLYHIRVEGRGILTVNVECLPENAMSLQREKNIPTASVESVIAAK